MNQKEMIVIIKELEARVVSLEEFMKKVADRRGPKSDREMVDDDARKILKGGENENLSHKQCAEKMGLSYAQVYSCRKSFTFKHIHKEIENLAKEVV
jgi:hypothetical protein